MSTIRRQSAGETVWNYIASESQSTETVLQNTRRYASLMQCHDSVHRLNLDINVYFWSTQRKASQLSFFDCSTDVCIAAEEEDLVLCSRCGHWIPLDVMYLHLPIVELSLIIASGIGASNFSDTITGCFTNIYHDTSLEENNHLRLRWLKQADWPEICATCHCVVMHSFSKLHRSSVDFCKQARLATTVALGNLSVNSFGWYPGHPLMHHYYINKQHILALLILHRYSLARLRKQYETLHLAKALVGLTTQALSIDLLLNIIDHILPCGINTPTLVPTLILHSQDKAAFWVIRRQVRNHLMLFRSDIMGLADI